MSVPVTTSEQATLALLEQVLKMPGMSVGQQVYWASQLVGMPHGDGPQWTHLYNRLVEFLG
jgi:hypothetical protein